MIALDNKWYGLYCWVCRTKNDGFEVDESSRTSARSSGIIDTLRALIHSRSTPLLPHALQLARERRGIDLSHGDVNKVYLGKPEDPRNGPQ